MMSIKYCVVDEFGNGIMNWCGFEKASREYAIRKNRGERVEMLEKESGKPPVVIPEM